MGWGGLGLGPAGAGLKVARVGDGRGGLGWTGLVRTWPGTSQDFRILKNLKKS